MNHNAEQMEGKTHAIAIMIVEAIADGIYRRRVKEMGGGNHVKANKLAYIQPRWNQKTEHRRT